MVYDDPVEGYKLKRVGLTTKLFFKLQVLQEFLTLLILQPYHPSLQPACNAKNCCQCCYQYTKMF